MEGTFANRNENTGSWFIQEAFDEILQHPGQDLEKTIKRVTKKASLKQRNAKIGDNSFSTFPVPCRSHDTMTSSFVFKQRNS